MKIKLTQLAKLQTTRASIRSRCLLPVILISGVLLAACNTIPSEQLTEQSAGQPSIQSTILAAPLPTDQQAQTRVQQVEIRGETSSISSGTAQSPFIFEDKTDTERLAGAQNQAFIGHEEDSAVASKGLFKFPSYTKTVLSNGMTVYLLEKHDIPLITVKAVVKAGAVNDPISGMASMTAEGLLLGTKKYNKKQIEQITDDIGAGFDSGSNKESSFITADFLAKDSDVMFDVIRSVLIEPSFDKEEFAKFQKKNMALLAQRKESPKKVIGGYYSKFVFDKHAYSNPIDGDPHSISTLTPTQLINFHGMFYQPVNTAITVVGDFNANLMKLELEVLFSEWKNTQPVPQIDLNYAVPVMEQSRVLVVNKDNATETTFMFGGLGVAKGNPDYIGIQLINTILGGRFTSWLNDELRVNSGLTYGADSGFSAWSQSGIFSISSFTQTASTEQAVDLALATYDRLWQKGVDQATLDSAKAYLKGQFPPRYETSEQLADMLGDMFVFGIDDSYVNRFESKVDALTLEETQSLVNKYFPNKNLQFVMIGKANELTPFVGKYGSVKTLNITETGFGG
ncbi:insulinase family protein [Photobacterium sagamiensis]|uniref:M16 family metallopeptidase n=1 Tax=Photobacterium sagamiensis TaxID=2910241 RepID=UPI003D115976